jgi:hypothetical protein
MTWIWPGARSGIRWCSGHRDDRDRNRATLTADANQDRPRSDPGQPQPSNHEIQAARKFHRAGTGSDGLQPRRARWQRPFHAGLGSLLHRCFPRQTGRRRRAQLLHLLRRQRGSEPPTAVRRLPCRRPDATVYADTIAAFYQAPWDVLGGGLAIGVAVPYVWLEVEAQAQRIGRTAPRDRCLPLATPPTGLVT